MQRYLKIYLTLWRLNFSALVAYRSNFINSIISSIAWGSFSLYSIIILTSRSTLIFGWKREELLLLNGLYGMVIGIFHLLISRNMERFARIIHFGELDFILLKPLDSQFAVSFWLVSYTNFFRILIALIYTLVIMQGLHLSISLFQLFYFFILVCISLILLYAIWFLILTLTVWFTRLSNLVDVMYTLTGIARYPQEVTRQLSNYIFLFLLPFTFIITTPTKLFLHKSSLSDLIILVLLATGTLYLSRLFWRFALRYYTSASS